MSENFEEPDDLERQPLLLASGCDNNVQPETNTISGTVSVETTLPTRPKKTFKSLKNYFFKAVFGFFMVYAFVLVMVTYDLYCMRETMIENQHSLRDLVVNDDNRLILTVDAFQTQRFIPVEIVTLGFNFLVFPLVNFMKFKYYLPDCNNNPTIAFDLPIKVELLKGENGTVVPVLSTDLHDHFIPYQLSHQVCAATEDFVLTPLDLMIEYVSRNKADKDEELERNFEKEKNVYWEEEMKIGIQPYKLPLKTVQIPEDLIRNSTFIQNLEILNNVEFNNTKFDLFTKQLSGDFYIEIVLEMLQNVNLINFKMIKGVFTINLQDSEKDMLLVEIPQWQGCNVYALKEEYLDMVIEMSLKDAKVKVLDQSEFTRFGKRWIWDKRVDIGISSNIDLIISDDKWLGSMVLQGLRSHDKAELRA